MLRDAGSDAGSGHDQSIRGDSEAKLRRPSSRVPARTGVNIGPVWLTELAVIGPLGAKWSRGPIGDGLAGRFTLYGWLTLCWRI